MIKYLTQGTLWAFVGKVSAVLIQLIISFLLARILLPADMGVYFLAFNLASFFALFIRFGLDNTLLRLVTESLANNKAYQAYVVIRKSLGLLFSMSVIWFIIIYTGGGTWLSVHVFHSEKLSSVMIFVSFWAIGLSFQFVVAEIFRAFHDIRSAVLYGGLFTAIGTVIYLVFYWLSDSNVVINYIFLIIIIILYCNIFFAGIIIKNKIKNIIFGRKIKKYTYKDILTFSFPLYLNSLTAFIIGQSDLWIIAAFMPESAVAIYGAAARLVLLSGMSLVVANSVVAPLISRLTVQNQHEKLEYILRMAATIAFIPTFFIVCIFIFQGDFVLGLVFGDKYQSGSMILAILSIGQLISVFSGSCGYTLVMAGNRITLLTISIISAVVAICGSIILVHYYNSVGVAFAMVAANIFQNILLVIFSRIQCGVWTHVNIRYFAHIPTLILRLRKFI